MNKPFPYVIGVYGPIVLDEWTDLSNMSCVHTDPMVCNEWTNLSHTLQIFNTHSVHEQTNLSNTPWLHGET